MDHRRSVRRLHRYVSLAFVATGHFTPYTGPILQFDQALWAQRSQLTTCPGSSNTRNALYPYVLGFLEFTKMRKVSSYFCFCITRQSGIIHIQERGYTCIIVSPSLVSHDPSLCLYFLLCYTNFRQRSKASASHRTLHADHCTSGNRTAMSPDCVMYRTQGREGYCNFGSIIFKYLT